VPNPEAETVIATAETAPLEWLKQCRTALSSGFVRSVIATYATRVFLMGVALVTTIIVARLLGPEGRGLYAVATALGALGVQFGNLGMHTANVYYAARDPQTLPSLIGNTLVVGLGMGAVLSAAAGAVLIFAPALVSLNGTILLLALLWIPLGLTYLLTQDLMLGVHDIRGYNLLEIANKTIPVALMGVVAWMQRVSVARLFATTVLATATCAAWGLVRLTSKYSYPRVSFGLFRGTFQYAFKAYLITFFAFLVFRADLFMVQRMLGPEQAGYYSIASSMADPVWVLATVVGTILLPKLSAMSDLRSKLRLTRRAIIGIALSLLPLLLLASLLAAPVIRLLFGSAFLPARMPFLLLMPGMLFLGVETVAMQFLNSIGCPAAVVWILGSCAVFNILVNLRVIGGYGIAGAATVSSVTYFLASTFVLWSVWRVSRRQLNEPDSSAATV
jgi:O-antigen/teichoic acid export membrane protein